MVEDFEYIIVGRGCKGVTATRLMLKADKSAKLLEACEIIIERVHTAQFEGFYLDKGGTWLGYTQDKIHKLICEFGL